jgi:Tfp pilus assembly protein PilF
MSSQAEESSSDRRLRFVHREVILLTVLVAVAVGAFAITRMAAAANRAMRRTDAASWYRRAQDELRGGRPEAATSALRRAAAMDPTRSEYRLELARALAAAGQDDEARQILIGQQLDEPENPDIHLQLARLDARSGDVAAAVREYQQTLAALWTAEQLAARRRVRIELIEFLLSHDLRSRALSELLVLLPNLPENPAAHTSAGQMLLRAGDARRALAQFADALRRDPKAEEALAGAGEAAFELGDYAQARRHLAAAPASLGRVKELQTIVGLVLTTDPLAPRLGLAERRRRLALHVTQAAIGSAACLARLPSSPAPPPAAALSAAGLEVDSLAAALETRAAPRTREAIEEAFDVAYRAARAAEQTCGRGGPADRATLLIGQRYGLEGS